AIAAYLQQFLLEPGSSLKECTFIFGHTHEPESRAAIETLGGTHVHIYNTGGWVIDQVNSEGEWMLPLASPLYIDEAGIVHTTNFTHHHHTFLKNHVHEDPRFQNPVIVTPA